MGDTNEIWLFFVHDVALFLGFPIDSSFASAMKKLDPKILDFFFHSSSGDYLLEVSHEGTPYLGKYVEELCSVSEITLLQSNIYSILKKLLPSYPYDDVPLVVFATEKPS